MWDLTRVLHKWQGQETGRLTGRHRLEETVVSGVLGGILEPKKDIGGKAGEI